MALRRTEYMPLSAVRRAAVNPKRHDQDGIRGSISDQGFVEIPAIDERTGRLVAGHGRLTALEELHAAGADLPDGVDVDKVTGEWLMPVQRGWASATDAHAAAYLAASNKLTENGGWDPDELAAHLSALDDVGLLHLSAFTADELGALLRVDDDDMGPGAGDGDQGDGDNVVYGVVVFCNGEVTQDALLHRLQGQGHSAKTIAAAGARFGGDA